MIENLKNRIFNIPFNGGDAQSMTASKRFHHQFLPDVIRHEKDAFTNDVKEDLQMKGHNLQEISNYGI